MQQQTRLAAGSCVYCHKKRRLCHLARAGACRQRDLFSNKRPFVPGRIQLPALFRQQIQRPERCLQQERLGRPALCKKRIDPHQRPLLDRTGYGGNGAARILRHKENIDLPYARQVAARKQDVLAKVKLGTNTVSGEISLDKPKLLVLSIPYSKGWRAFIDGVPAKLCQANTMYMALDLDTGNHTVKLTYSTPLLWEGGWISVFCILLFAVLCFLEKRTAFWYFP